MFRPALSLFVLFTLLTGVIYPGLITAFGQAIFPEKANGSLLYVEGKIAGSSLLGQSFSGERYFHGRPSATARVPYDAAASSGSNLGPTNPALLEQRSARELSMPGAPADLLASSASGLDPHISPEAARYQVARVARARGLEPAKVEAAIATCTEGQWLGLYGEARVNVLELNLLLDRTPAR